MRRLGCMDLCLHLKGISCTKFEVLTICDSNVAISKCYVSSMLTFNKWMGEQYPIRCTSFSVEWENTVPQWAFKFNSTLDAAETWHLKGHTQKVNNIDVLCMHSQSYMDEHTKALSEVFTPTIGAKMANRYTFLPLCAMTSLYCNSVQWVLQP